MPAPKSSRGNAVTGAAIEAPFETPILPFGQGGLDLVSAVDAIAPGNYSRLENLTYSDQGNTRTMTPRPGLTALLTVAAPAHSLVRMDLPAVNGYQRVIGGGTSVYQGAPGVVLVDTGYSGNPLTILPHRPPISSAPWAFIADSARMRKISSAGVVMPIGLPAPGSQAGMSLGTERRTSIANFASDGTQPGNWTANKGRTFNTPPGDTGVPAAATGVLPVVPDGSAPITFSTGANNLTLNTANGYYVFWGCAATRNLNLVGGVTASDEDYFHTWVYMTRAEAIDEISLYFVCSATFSPSIVPGTDSLGTANTDAYVRTFSGSDFSAFIKGTQTQLAASEIARQRAGRNAALLAQRKSREAQNNQNLNAVLATTDPSRTITEQGATGAAAWQEYGIVGVPMRRGDFQRIGNTNTRNWGTITGIIVRLRVRPQETGVSISLANMYLTGGAGPDSGDAASSPYDVRYTHYDPRTGAESNPSPEIAATGAIDSLRRPLAYTGAAYGNAAIRQRFYRRGGTLVDDWFFTGTSTSDGGGFTDTNTDAAIAAAGTVALDHYQAVPSVNATGDAVLAQPVPVIFGPYNAQLFALGDPNRAGSVYASIPDQPDHWPADLVHEVCAPSEELMNGVMFGGQPYVFSRQRLYILYPNQSGNAGMSSQPTGCARGLAARWALTVGAGAIWFVSTDGVYRTTGGAPEKVSTAIGSAFYVDATGAPCAGVNSPFACGGPNDAYPPIDFSVPAAIRLAVYRDELWFGYQDTEGDRHVYVYQILTQRWRRYTFSAAPASFLAEEGQGTTLVIGASSGAVFTHAGCLDGTDPIQWHLRTGSWDWGRPREEKLFGDQILDATLNGTTITWTNYFNADIRANAPVIIGTGAAADSRVRAIFDNFGATPQRARSLAIDLAGEVTAAGEAPILYYVGTAITPQPDLTVGRVTNWDDGGSPDPKYVTGVTFDCDTCDEIRTVVIERDWNGQVSQVASLEVRTNGRHKVSFSWPGVSAHQIRVRPTDATKGWLLYRADWIVHPEPPVIAGWDVYFEDAWDQYGTGLDLFVDTFGETKRIVVEVDGTVLSDPATGNPYWDIATTGRRVVHLTLPWFRGHVLHFTATDANPGMLFDYRWHLVPEPSEQANWNQPFTILGTQADKWLKAVVFEVDTFGQDKTVNVEADGVVVSSLTVNADGRSIVQLALPQVLGRVFRFFPIDHVPSRLYSIRPVFDEEPFALTRWETQEIDHGIPTFQTVVQANVTLKSNEPVTLTLTTYINQPRPGTGDVLTVEDQYTLESTGGVKAKVWVPCVARKGVLFKWLFTADTPFWLYQEESDVLIQPWGSGEARRVSPWGNSDNDQTRNMVNTSLAAARSGGGS